MFVDSMEKKTKYASIQHVTTLPNRLPPSKDSPYLHFDRVNDQVREWKGVLDRQFTNGDRVGKGWCIQNDCLEIKWSKKLPAPESILKFTACQCKNKCHWFV